MAVARRRSRAAEPDEHESEERWLVTYADMITVLMVLFIVLYSISQVDLAKFEQFRAGLAEFGNGGASLLEGEGAGLLEEPAVERLRDAEAALDAQTARQALVAADRSTLAAAEAAIEADLAAKGLGNAARFRLEERGLVVTVVTDRVLFDPGSDVLTGAGRTVIDAIAGAVASLPNHVSVEGHTDSVPIANARFRSNWELSTARATSVLQALLRNHEIAPARLSAAGYADQRPVAPNDTVEGRAANRRVAIVVHSTVADTA